MKTWILGISLLSAASLGGCTINGKSMFGFGAAKPSGAGDTNSGGTYTTAPDAANPYGRAIVNGRDNGPGPANVPSSGSSTTPAPTSQNGMAPTAPNTNLAWCKGVKPSDYGYTTFQSFEEADDAVRGIANGLCFPKADGFKSNERVRGELEAAKLNVMAALGMTQADWEREVPGFVNTERELHPKVAAKTQSTLKAGPIDQLALILDGNAFMTADEIPQLSQIGRVGVMRACAQASVLDEIDGYLCNQQSQAFDLAKFNAEMAADKSSARDHMAVRIAYAVANAQRETWKDGAAALKPKLVEKIKAAQAEWASNYAARKPYLDVLAAAEEAERLERHRDRDDDKVTQVACAEKVAPAIERLMAKYPASKFDGIEAGMFSDHAGNMLSLDPDGWIAANIVRACAVGPDKAFAQILRPDAVHFRGPWTAVQSAVAVSRMTADYGHKYYQHEITGVIASVGTTADGVHVTFVKKAKFQEAQCAEWRSTNRVERIDSSGYVRYEQVCARKIEVTIDPTEKPVDLPKRFAAGVEKGRFLEMSEKYAVPTIYATETSKTPIAAYGVLLK